MGKELFPRCRFSAQSRHIYPAYVHPVFLWAAKYKLKEICNKNTHLFACGWNPNHPSSDGWILYFISIISQITVTKEKHVCGLQVSPINPVLNSFPNIWTTIIWI